MSDERHFHIWEFDVDRAYRRPKAYRRRRMTHGDIAELRQANANPRRSFRALDCIGVSCEPSQE